MHFKLHRNVYDTVDAQSLLATRAHFFSIECEQKKLKNISYTTKASAHFPLAFTVHTRVFALVYTTHSQHLLSCVYSSILYHRFYYKLQRLHCGFQFICLQKKKHKTQNIYIYIADSERNEWEKSSCRFGHTQKNCHAFANGTQSQLQLYRVSYSESLNILHRQICRRFIIVDFVSASSQFIRVCRNDGNNHIFVGQPPFSRSTHHHDHQHQQYS